MNLWLIRIYAVIILAVLWLNFIEGVAYDLVITLAAALIVVQSFAKPRSQIQ